MAVPKPFLDALASSRRGPAIAEANDIFGFLIGSWEIDAVLHNADGRRQTSKGEVHAAARPTSLNVRGHATNGSSCCAA
jgi:hypothetical protein